MQVADKDGLRQIASEEEFKSLVIECGLNQPRTVSLKHKSYKQKQKKKEKSDNNNNNNINNNEIK